MRAASWCSVMSIPFVRSSPDDEGHPRLVGWNRRMGVEGDRGPHRELGGVSVRRSGSEGSSATAQARTTAVPSPASQLDDHDRQKRTGPIVIGAPAGRRRGQAPGRGGIGIHGQKTTRERPVQRSGPERSQTFGARGSDSVWCRHPTFMENGPERPLHPVHRSLDRGRQDGSTRTTAGAHSERQCPTPYSRSALRDADGPPLSSILTTHRVVVEDALLRRALGDLHAPALLQAVRSRGLASVAFSDRRTWPCAAPRRTGCPPRSLRWRRPVP